MAFECYLNLYEYLTAGVIVYKGDSTCKINECTNKSSLFSLQVMVGVTKFNKSSKAVKMANLSKTSLNYGITAPLELLVIKIV